jgi:intermediate peptidase
LFGVPWLSLPSDFLRGAQAAVAVCNPLVAAASDAGAPVTLRTLRQLDTVSDTICKVLDAAECTRNVHADAAWRDAANDTYLALASYMFHLNAHVPLYAALCRVTADAALMQSFTEEQRRVALLLRREFERDGINRSPAERRGIVALNGDIAELSAQFAHNIATTSGVFEVRVRVRTHPPGFICVRARVVDVLSLALVLSSRDHGAGAPGVGARPAAATHPTSDTPAHGQLAAQRQCRG